MVQGIWLAHLGIGRPNVASYSYSDVISQLRLLSYSKTIDILLVVCSSCLFEYYRAACVSFSSPSN